MLSFAGALRLLFVSFCCCFGVCCGCLLHATFFDDVACSVLGVARCGWLLSVVGCCQLFVVRCSSFVCCSL